MPVISLIIGYQNLLFLLLRVVSVALVMAVYWMYVILRCPLAEYIVTTAAIGDDIRHGKAHAPLVKVVKHDD